MKKHIIILYLLIVTMLAVGFRSRYDFGGGAFVKWLQLDTTFTTDEHSEGRLSWNFFDGVPQWDLPGGVVSGQLFQEFLDRAINDEGEQINNGEVVFISGGSGNFSKVQTPIATNPAEAPLTYAVATEDITDNQKGYVTLIGKVRDIDTTGGAENWVDGQVVYLSATTEGGLTKTRPTPPNIGVVIGVVLRAHATEGVLGVKPIVIQRISLASDVFITNIQDGDVLAWDSTDNRWENVAP